MSNQIPVCVHTSVYQGWEIQIECDQTYRFITSRNDLITEKSGFDSIESALNAAIAQVDEQACMKVNPSLKMPKPYQWLQMMPLQLAIKLQWKLAI